MVWKRKEPGHYVSGQFEVVKTWADEWYAEGPLVDQVFDTKKAAQAACQRAVNGGIDPPPERREGRQPDREPGVGYVPREPG